jgi:hypothetical protein
MERERPARLSGLVPVALPLRQGGILVVQPDDPAGEPPPDRPAHSCAPAPAVGIATTLAIARIVDSLEETAAHKVQASVSHVKCVS